MELTRNEILNMIKKIEADDDWDGISAAVQMMRHLEIPPERVSISPKKVVPSDAQTVVLDKRTSGDGWVVDHHTTDSPLKNILAFCENGLTPTSTLVYRLLPEKDETDLFLSATAEITEGLDEHGWKHGSLGELCRKYPKYLQPSPLKSQFVRKEKIYPIADVVALVAMEEPYEALKLGPKLSPRHVADAGDLKAMFNVKLQKRVDEYFEFMENFPTDRFFPMDFDGYAARIGNASDFRFPLPALARMEREFPGNYLLYKGANKGLSVRTYDRQFVETVVRRLGTNVKSYGGRVSWWGISLHNDIGYNKFLEALRN
ncbi:MAG TPA: hypothetical protein VI933_02390 [archaeon]|nr:hypothetical protein [archaeon]